MIPFLTVQQFGSGLRVENCRNVGTLPIPAQFAREGAVESSPETRPFPSQEGQALAVSMAKVEQALRTL